MLELIGHFHPLIVHLPIGILLAALFLIWLSGKPAYAGVKPAIAPILLAGVLGALISVITGLLLSKSDDYDQGLVNWHMWFAFSVLITSAVLFTKEVNPKVEVSKKWLAIGLFIMIMITGHLGGSLTHGSDYLTKPFGRLFNGDSLTNKTIAPLPNVQEAMAYANVIQPILETRCYSCHNANKKKGGLRMDDIALLMKGGKNGKVIDLDIADSSEMLKRLLLPVDNEDHMPPKEKPQPTESQVALIHWWIYNHADFTKKVSQLNQPDRIKPLLLALQKPVEVQSVAADLPTEKVGKANEATIQALTERSVMVLPVAQNSNYLTVSITAPQAIEKKDLELLEKIKDQLIWLKVEDVKIQETNFLSKLTNLRRLNLSGSMVNDKLMQSLQPLQKLEYLNLVGTQVTASGLLLLSNIKTLRSVYIYQTKVAAKDYPMLAKAFPKTTIDTGNYKVPLLPTDTAIVKAEKKY